MNISPTTVLLEIASFRNQALGALMNSSSSEGSDGSESTDFAQILGAKTAAASSTSAITAASGRVSTLPDPESAYGMMTEINAREVSFKAQYSELNQMGISVEQMEEVGGQLSDIDPSTANAEITAQMQNFVTQYNAWVDRYAPDIQSGGVLANVQAAEISLYELEQSVKNIFNGAADGVDGMADLGVSIDPISKRATLDAAKLDAVLTSNKNGAVNAIDEFSANFAKSADLLNSAGNFIPTQLDNRSRAIQYIADNKTSLQAEFGSGDSAQPTGQVAKALVAYEQAFGMGVSKG